MAWFRTHVRSGAWCALLALALQLAVAFGHVHVGQHAADVFTLASQAAPAGGDLPADDDHDPAGQQPGDQGAGDRGSGRSAGDRNSGQDNSGPHKTGDPRSGDHKAADVCLICRLVQLAGLGLAPTPPSVPLPMAIADAPASAFFPAILAAADTRPVRARGPPLV